MSEEVKVFGLTVTELSRLPAKEIEGYRRLLDLKADLLDATPTEEEPVDGDGLNASERKACTAYGCDPVEFLRVKAALRQGPA